MRTPVLMAMALSLTAAFTLRTRAADHASAAPTTVPAASSLATAQPVLPASPSSMPAMQPADGVIRGRVSIDGLSAFQKPDLSRIVVYLAASSALDDASPAAHAIVAQRNKSFVPNFVVIQCGTNVEFPNWDDFDHNVFSRSKAAPAFDLDRYPRGRSKTRTFDKVGVVQVFCNIHPQMRAIIFVTPNSHYVRADADGRFELKDLPAGSFDLVAWQDRCDECHQSITVNSGGVSEVALTLHESRKNAIENDPPRRGAAYGVERGLGVKHERLDLPVVKESHPACDPEP